MPHPTPLHTRWLGTVAYREADVLQRALHAQRERDYVLLLDVSGSREALRTFAREVMPEFTEGEASATA